MKWIDTTSLRTWAAKRDCQEYLPLLIRKLIRATSDSIRNISFPAGENVLIGGWDGILEVYKETEYLPLGKSLWEFGSNLNIKGKADEDYKKRKGDALGFNADEVTYIFVTPRLWTRKERWIAEKQAERHWKDVRVYDAQDLEEWIELAPSVGAWLAVNHLNLFPKGIQAADDFWEEWATGNKIRFIPDVVLAGRQQQVRALYEQSGQPSIIPVRASSREEAIAFIVAAFKSDDSVAEDFFARALVVDSIEAFRELVGVGKPLYLIVRFDDDSIINRAKIKGHVIYVPLGIDNSGQWSERVDLPGLERQAFMNALIKCGLEEGHAEKISKRSARNLAVLRRQLEFNRLIPEWAHPGNVRDVIPAMLVERWDENLAGDRQIIELFAGESYEMYIAKLKKWLYTADAPVVQIGSNWRLTSPLDAWTNAGKYCTRADFERLNEIFLQVFGLPDPKFQLPPEERHQSSWHGVSRNHSSWLREGLSQSLILMSVYGDKIGIDLPIHPESWVDHVIITLISADSPDVWKSLDYELPLLAEASPSSFITKLEELLQVENGPLQQLFEEEKGFLHSHSYHTGLLWGLENVAWMPEYLTRASLILAELAAIDPGGTLVNRPINTLNAIFKSWFPQTLAPLEKRLEALTVVVQSNNDIGLRIIKGLLPSSQNVAHPTHKMRWRLADESIAYGVEYEVIYKTHAHAIELLKRHFDQGEASFDELIEESFHLNHWDREKVLDFLDEQLNKVDHPTHKVWHTLRKTIGRHRTYPDAPWSLSEQVLARYQKLYDKLTPADPIEQISWVLKEHFPEFVEGQMRRVSFEERTRIVDEKKAEAVRSLYAKYGLDVILRISNELSGIELQSLAFAVADVVDNEQDLHQICEGLKTNNRQKDFAQYIIDRKKRVHGNEFVFKLYHQLKSEGFEVQALGNLFLRLQADRVLWDFIDNSGQTLIDNYWTKIDSFYFHIPKEDLTEAIFRFMKYQRHTSALHLAYNAADQLDGVLLTEVLMKFITSQPEKDVRLETYEVDYIFDELRKKDKIDHTTFIKLEWLFLPLLDRGFDHANTPFLHQEMAENPAFFIEVLGQLYKTETGEQEVTKLSDEQIQQKVLMAKSAHKLFKTWHAIPGVDGGGNIDEGKLKGWIREVLRMAKANGRLRFAEIEIGSLFAKYPETNQKMDPDRELNWPPDILCDIMEEINSESLFRNFSTGTYNKRSFSSRGPFDGGGREWHIAEYFRTLARLKATKFPHIGAILQDLAKDFEHQAKDQDERAERDRLDY